MARKRAVVSTVDPAAEAIQWYRDQLGLPAPPPESYPWPPVVVGPSWQTADGHWLLPEVTLGWDVLGWCAEWLEFKQGVPWRFTLEQARFILWWYSIDADGRFLFRDGVLQRLKGWGKDPVGACLCAVEAFGPCRFGGWDDDGTPISIDNPDAWVQTAAVSLEQTKNTMRLFPGLLSAAAKHHYGIHVGKEMIHGLGDRRLIQAVTSSPSTLEGARSTFVLLNETQHWTSSNGGHEMAAVITRNATKSVDGAARTLRITNAYEPSDDSVAQRDREAFELSDSGGSLTTGILYDSLEAPPEAPLTAEDAPEVVLAIRGDSIWLDVERIVGSILDTREPPSRSRRFWYNQIVAAEDAWVRPQDFDSCTWLDGVVTSKEEIVLFFDGSKSDDATGLMGCRLNDGHVITLGMWQRPPGERGKGWISPRHEIDQAVDSVFENHNVVAFFADPSHALDDETQASYWDGVIDGWHRRYKDRLKIWAVPGVKGHSVMWDMSSTKRTADFTAAAELCAEEIESSARIVTEGGQPTFTHDGDARLRRHTHNAKRYPNKHGVSLWKGHRESPRKIDLTVCMVGARMVRRLVLNAEPAKKRTGVIWGSKL